MKTHFLKPGFEFVFSFSLMVILGLPPMLMAQNQKDVEIKIMNGDTTINGKNIKDLSAADRKNALKDIHHLSGDVMMNGGDHQKRVYFFKRTDTLDGKTMGKGRKQLFTENIVINDDSLGNAAELRLAKPGARNKRMRVEYRTNTNSMMPDRMEWSERNEDRRFGEPMMRFEHRNSQNFNYVNTDNDGISTHISFHVSEVNNDDLKRIPPIEGAKLEITDLNIIPQFSTGKTLLLFSLPGKVAADVKLYDTEGRLIWADKSQGSSFSKTFVMGLNGIYFLQVKQGNKVTVKRIMKEE